MNKAIIMAAGEGTRMKSNISKVLHKVLNKTILSYIIDSAKESGMNEIIVIVGRNEQAVKEEFGDKLKFVKQEIGEGIPYGTGYAVKLSENYIEDNDSILVLNGDIPLITEKSLREFAKYHNENQNDATVLTADFEDPTGYGRVITDEKNNLIKIVEHRDCNEEELEVKEINSGIYIFNGKKLKDALNKLDQNNDQGELYITDVFGILKNENSKISAFKIIDNEEIMGINNKVQLSEVESVMRRRINEKYMLDGVIIENPDTVTIQKGVKIGRDTIVEQNVKILGDVQIGENSLIGMNSQIVDSKIGDNVQVYSSFIEGAIVENNADVGPFARLRKNSHLKEKVHIGNFVEVKNSVIGKGTKSGHLTYIGDSDLGENINVSCGVIFANYDGINKFRSKVGDNSFIGSNVNIISPINIADKAFLAAGSTITKDVEEGQLAVERAQQKNIDGYYDRKFKK